MFENYKTFKTDFAGRPLVVETGKLAGLANGSCLVRYGDTAILCCATASARPRDGIDFLPLSVDFEERMYAVGRIPGGYLKREGRPSEKAILTSRVIDRPIRPLFPKDLRNDVNLNLTVMAVDHDCSPEITAMIGASIALSISDIPWNGPIGGVFMGMTEEDGFIVNPTSEQRERSCLELTVAASEKKVVMIEAGAKEVSDEDMYDAIMLAHSEIKKLLVFINEIIAAVGKTLKELEAKIGAPIAGLHLVHCGGRRAGIGDRINEVYDQVKAAVGDIPFLMEYTFGEYGYEDDGRNTCGGLMLSFTAFGK